LLDHLVTERIRQTDTDAPEPASASSDDLARLYAPLDEQEPA
jgi:hypothetical protein